ncbi:DUF4274 domain-containing protein [Gallaecimonas xiamenensis]|uniref:DUF4274 domain-containing protein n=1 Tax=Gallaecimonas xiamenensis 3-C-1 TaxID=745411 RepID=K2J454_9GAMM|nr:DUF4274 domain-containing protein [Gallaecimonas xiamenensis]EKE77796.1 hypothetical protein B3C1_00010 [Gallaecimonas xiamenensis 3-C-1]
MIKWQRVHEIDDLMGSEDISWIEVCRRLKNSEELHYAMTVFNWDDGVDFPVLILKRPECDLGTIMYMFEMIDEEPEVQKIDYYDFEEDMKMLSIKLREKWASNDYPSNISHDGSPGEKLVAEWKSRHSHYEIYPDEQPSDA